MEVRAWWYDDQNGGLSYEFFFNWSSLTSCGGLVGAVGKALWCSRVFLMVVMWSRLGKKIKVSGERRTRARTKVLQFGWWLHCARKLMVVLVRVLGVGVGCLVVAMAASVSLLILTVQAVPTLLSCLAFTASFSPLFLVSSFPFSSLFVSLSLCISVASWCSYPSDGSSSRRRDEKEKKTSLSICHREISPSEISAVQTRYICLPPPCCCITDNTFLHF